MVPSSINDHVPEKATHAPISQKIKFIPPEPSNCKVMAGLTKIPAPMI